MNLDVTNNKVTHYTCALGEENKREHGSGRGNFRSKNVDPRWKFKEKQNIYTLDHFRFEDINLIKVDVDGMDEEVIKGAVETIKRCKPLIIIEELKDSKGIHKDYIMVPKTL
jgi:FkbM family methyltransferase